MATKRAHMVSKGYLRGWADDGNRVRVWDLQKGATGARSISDATVVSYAYRSEHLSNDLETEYAQVEGDGIPALKTLADGGQLQAVGEEAVVRFLDMHRERGVYADQVDVRVPAVAGGIGIEPRQIEMGLGDRLTLSRDVDKDAIRLTSLPLASWRWRVEPIESGLATGDGAVMLWQAPAVNTIQTVTFPLSRIRLLVVGEELDLRALELNWRIVNASRRWIVDHVDGYLRDRLSFTS